MSEISFSEVFNMAESSFSKSNSVFIRPEDIDSLLKGRPVVEGITIDGPTSMDLDDGICLVNSGDHYLLQVSISDVASVVKPGSKLFFTSLEKAETIYRSTYNIPMLPRFLSENLLSLLGGSTRPAITFEMEIHPDGSVGKFTLSEKAFHNRRRLSYDEFDDIINNKPEDPDYANFTEMYRLADFLLNKRREQGALAIYDLKKGIYTNEEGVIMALSKESAHKANIVIQEFMILTNQSLAWYCAENNIPLLYRNHTARMNVPARSEILKQINTAILNPKYMEALRGRSQIWFNKADYGTQLIGHYGLNLPAYTHITSPIRRMADLLSHTFLKAHINNSAYPFEYGPLNDMVATINQIILQNKIDKGLYHKEHQKINIGRLLENAEPGRMLKMDKSKFESLISVAVLEQDIPENLRSTLETKFETMTIDPHSIYRILFKTPRESESWQEFRKTSLKYLESYKSTASEMLNMMKQKKLIEKLHMDVFTAEGNFHVRTSCRQNGNIFQAPHYSYALKKKDAAANSFYLLLHVLLQIPLPADPYQSAVTPPQKGQEAVPVDSEDQENIDDCLDNLPYGAAGTDFSDSYIAREFETTKEEPVKTDTAADNTVAPPVFRIQEDTSAGPNYTGQLLEMCQSKKGWGLPAYDFKVKGRADKPVVFCRCTLFTKLSKFEEFAMGPNKKAAKKEASRKMIDTVNECIRIYWEKRKEAENLAEEDKNDTGTNDTGTNDTGTNDTGTNDTGTNETGTNNTGTLLCKTAPWLSVNKKGSINKLLEYCTKHQIETPGFAFSVSGSDHKPTFECTLTIEWACQTFVFKAKADTKKEAKYNAATECLKNMKFESWKYATSK